MEPYDNATRQKQIRIVLFSVLILLAVTTSPLSTRSSKGGSILSVPSRSGLYSSRTDFWDGFHERLTVLEERARFYPKDARAQYEYASLCLKGFDYAGRAKEAFEKALSLKPDFAEACSGMGWAYLDTWGMRNAILVPVPKSDLEQAVGFFKRAIEINPDYADSYLGLSYSYIELGSYWSALESLQRLIQLDSGNKTAWDLLSRTYEALGQIEEAIGARLQHMRFVSDEIEDLAITSHNYYPSREPDDYLELIELGGLYEKSLHYDEAIDAYRQAIEKNSAEPLGYHHLGLAYLGTGDKQSAFNQLTKLRSICNGAESETPCDHYEEDLLQRIHE